MYVAEYQIMSLKNGSLCDVKSEILRIMMIDAENDYLGYIYIAGHIYIYIS